jgi:hypothetical protein
MRRFGKLLLYVGAGVGLVSVTALVLPWHVSGIAWLLGVGLTKLGLGSSVGLMGAGAIAQRAALQRKTRNALPPSSDS